MTTPTYAPWQQRVIDEQRDLNEKIVKLTAFIYGSEPRTPSIDWELMQEQLRAMQTYSGVLCRRIISFYPAVGAVTQQWQAGQLRRNAEERYRQHWEGGE